MADDPQPNRSPSAGPEDPPPAGEERAAGERLSVRQGAVGVLGALRDQLTHIEQVVGADVEGTEQRLLPVWQKVTTGEPRLPVAVAIAVAIGLQLVLPQNLVFRPAWVLPGLEAALLIGVVVANPRRIDRPSRALRFSSLGIIAMISLANAWSAGALIVGLIDGSAVGSSAGPLLANGAAIYLTNIIVFGLWYWEFDRGGPLARALGVRPYPDFLFPQMASPHLAAPDWEPNFFDYLYVSFTNATAFSPTDVLPLSRWAKALMLVQSAVSLATVALVVARAVNILK